MLVRALHEFRASLADPPDWLRDAIVGPATSTGVSVDTATALSAPAVYAVVRNIAEDLASLPLILYRRREDGGKDRAIEHPLYRLLHDQPNEEMTAMQLRECLMGFALLSGNAFAYVIRDRGERVRELWPLPTHEVTIVRPAKDAPLVYVWQPSDIGLGARRFDAKDVLHVRGLTRGGVYGISPIHLLREAVGLSVALERSAGVFFANAMRLSGVLSHPGKLSEKAQANLIKSLATMHTGLSNAHKYMLLEEGMKWDKTAVNPEEAQFLESRKFQVTEIARAWRIPPHKIADMERATFTNIEAQNGEYVSDTLRPWAVRTEQEIARVLLVGEPDVFAEHLFDALLRGDTKSRFEAYALAVNSGVMTRNEVRIRENLNPLDGLDEPILALNIGVVPPGGGAPVGGSPSPEPEPTPESRAKPIPVETRAITALGARRAAAVRFAPLFEDLAMRILKREIQDVTARARKDLDTRSAETFLTWLEGFYAKEHAEFVERQARKPFTAYAGLIHDMARSELGSDGMGAALGPFVEALIGAFVLRWTKSSAGQLSDIVRSTPAPTLEVLEERFAEWNETRPGKTAERESRQTGSAVARATYRASGIKKLQWVTVGDTCPFCEQFNGKIVGIDDTFTQHAEGPLSAEGKAPMRVKTKVFHPPLHDGCDCGIVPV